MLYLMVIIGLLSDITTTIHTNDRLTNTFIDSVIFAVTMPHFNCISLYRNCYVSHIRNDLPGIKIRQCANRARML